MGFMDRFEDVVGGLVSAVSETAGLISDIVTSPMNDDEEFNGFWNVLQERGLQRIGGIADGLVGPNQGLGAAIGGLPEGVRSPIRSVLTPVNNGLETAYREMIGEPFTAFATALSLAESETYRDAGGLGSATAALFRNETWKDAYKIAQARSPGQAIYLAFATKDILDDDEVSRVAASDAYFVATGVMDGVVRWFGDPLVIGGKVANATRLSAVVRPIRVPQIAENASDVERFAQQYSVAKQVDSLLDSRRGQRLLRDLAKMREEAGAARAARAIAEDAGEVADGARLALPETVISGREAIAGRIREEMFPTKRQADGDTAAVALAAANSDDEARRVLRVLLGDRRAVDELLDINAELAAELATGSFMRAEPGAWGTLPAQEAFDAMLNDSDIALGFQARAQRVADEISLNEKLIAMQGAFMSAPPRVSRTGQIRRNLAATITHQEGWWARPIHATITKRAPRIIELDAIDADISFSRLMRQTRVFNGDEMAEYRGAFMAGNAADRAEIIDRLETEALTRLGRQNGLSAEEMREIASGMQRGRQTARDWLKTRAYSADPRMSVVTDETGIHVAPLMVTQAPNAVAVSDFQQVRQALTRYGQFKRRHPGFAFWAEMPTDITDGIMSVWRAAVLLRPGRPIRSILFDEQLRVMAQLESTAEVLDLVRAQGRGAVNLMAELTPKMNEAQALARAGDDLARTDAALRSARRRQNRVGAVVGGAAGAALAGPVGAVAGAGVGAGFARGLGRIKQTGFVSLDPRIANVAVAPGLSFEADDLFRSKLSAGRNTVEYLRETTSRRLTNLRQTGRWATIDATNPGYADQWNRVVNRQFGQDALIRQILAGNKSVDELAEWVVNTPEGVAYYRQIPVRREAIRKGGVEYVREWITDLEKMVDSYTMNDQNVKNMAIQGKADVSWLIGKTQGNAGLLPPIHAEIVDQVMGRGKIMQALSDTVEKMFNYMDSAPVDQLVRSPLFAKVYAAKMKEKMGALLAGGDSTFVRLTQEQIDAMHDSARRAALGEVKDLLYDYADRSELHHILRNVVPFLPATQDAITTWSGIALRHPQNVARISMVYGSLASDLPQFTEGDPATREPTVPIYAVKDDLGRTSIRFRLPEWAAGLAKNSIFESAFDSQGYVQFDRQSMNMLIPADFGAGPLVQLPASVAVREMPEWEESLRFVLPFGPVSTDLAPIETPIGQVGVPSFLLPATFQRISASDAEGDSRAYRSAWAQIALTKMTKIWETGERRDFSDPEIQAAFIKEVSDQTKAVFRLRTVASFLSPVPTQFVSPYQPYIDEYRRLFRDFGVADADRKFIEQYGEEFFALTQRFTRSNDGVPATAAGLRAREEYEDLINKYPTLGGLIVGRDAGGVATQFSRGVYDRQLMTPVTPGSDVMQRSPLSQQEIITNPDERLGWIAYSRMRDTIDAVMVERGLTSMNVAAAADLRQARDLLLADLAEKYPSWWDAYNQPRSRLEDDKLIAGLRDLSNDPRLSDRPDMQGVAEYLSVRDAFMDELRFRRQNGGSGEITAVSNADLADAWEAIVQQMRTMKPWSLEFADLHARYLSRDVLSVSQEALAV